MTNPELLSIMSLLPALLPCYTFYFVNAENAVLKKKKEEKYRLKKLCCPENRQFVGNSHWETEQSDPDKHAGSENDICVGYLTVQGNLK